MILKNPCKKCLVMPMCKTICNDREVYTAKYEAIQKKMWAAVVVWVYLIFSLIVIILGKTDTLLYSWVVNFYTFYIIIYLSISIKCHRNLKYDKKRFFERTVTIGKVKTHHRSSASSSVSASNLRFKKTP
jgi:hypothetical protein